MTKKDDILSNKRMGSSLKLTKAGQVDKKQLHRTYVLRVMYNDFRKDNAMGWKISHKGLLS